MDIWVHRWSRSFLLLNSIAERGSLSDLINFGFEFNQKTIIFFNQHLITRIFPQRRK